MKDSKTLTRVIAATLTVLFMGFVFTAFGVMMVTHGGDIVDSVRLMQNLKGYLPENYNALDMLNARIQSFGAAISDNMWLKDEMGYVNSGFQYALGKRMITTGNQNMVTLNTGHLYDLQDYIPMEEAAQEIIDLQASLPADTPFMFVYEHPTLYDEDMMPVGYDVLDHSRQMADEVTSYLREAGIEVVDSRDVLPASGYALEDLLMYTDQHWSTLAAIVMAQELTGQINRLTGASLDASLLDLDQMNTIVHENLFLGKYGQRIGTGLIAPDDIVEYWPKYETSMTRHTLRVTSQEDAAGEFREVALRSHRFEPLEGKTWNITAYCDYGLSEAYDIYTNELAPDFTILLLKDSYSAPIGAFLSLVASDVISVDLRQDVGSVEDWVAEYDPDVIVMAYSLQMLRDDEYDFVG